MKIKKAIEFLKTFKDKVTSIDIENGDEKMIEEYNDEIDEVISLLQQGKKYRQMYLWSAKLCEEFKEEFKKLQSYQEMWEELEYHWNEETYDYDWCVQVSMDKIKDKYFPKEAK